MDQIRLTSSHLQKQIKYSSAHDMQYIELRKFRHDYKNHMKCLSDLIDMNRIEDAKNYNNSISLPEKSSNFIFETGNSLVNAILTDKNKAAHDAGGEIRFTGYISDGLPLSELCTIFFNALDNSIEALYQIDDKESSVINLSCMVDNGLQMF